VCSSDLAVAARTLSLDSLMLQGGYPALHTQPVESADWFASYVATYVERDVRQVLNIQSLPTFQRFLRLCAGRTGQLLNITALASEAGITAHTAKSWLAVLESSDLIHLLPPYHRNFGKRLVKMPKLYFLDTGLASWLLGIRSEEVLGLHPLRGALFENWVVAEFIKARYNRGQAADLYFWRDSAGHEVDLLYETAQGLQAVEIKSGATFASDWPDAIAKWQGFAKDEALPPTIVFGGEGGYQRQGCQVLGWRELANQ
jgi:predicted AAA+ superfamily ATPase